MGRIAALQRRLFVLGLSIAVILAVLLSPLAADTVLTLNADFIESFKSRVTIDVDFVVDKAHARPNRPEKDGDLHAAGRSEQIGLPMVAEMENAADVPDAVDKI